MTFLLQFLAWTFALYWIHRLAHIIPVVRSFHRDHHIFIRNNPVSWHWSNLFLYNDTPKSTIDLWLTEVIPTLLIAFLLDAWWIFVFYYLWAALIQESIEHNPKVNLPFLTSGKWHLIHHRNSSKNFGLFFPIWDVIFITNSDVKTART